jgi:MFS transporter, FHS family, glucose/mannose:H+ symporter
MGYASVMSKTATAAGFLAFFLIGAVQAFYGPAQFALRDRFAIDANTVSFIVSAHFLGSMTGILSLAPLERILGWRKVLFIGSSLLIIGCLSVAFAPVWELALLGAVIIGLGFGSLDLAFNTIFSTGFGKNSTAMTNILNALFGVGAIVGPVLISAFPNDSRTPFLIAAVATLTLMPLLIGLRASKLELPKTQFVSSGLFILFVLMFFVYVGVEVSAANLEPRHLKESLGLSQESAAQWNALYWGGITASRILIVPIALRFKPAIIVNGSVAIAVLGLALTHIPSIAPYAYILAGLGFGPIFPTGFVWLSQAIPSSVAASSLVLAAANFGAVLIPPIASVLASNPSAIPTVITILGVPLLVLSVLLLQKSQLKE